MRRAEQKRNARPSGEFLRVLSPPQEAETQRARRLGDVLSTAVTDVDAVQDLWLGIVIPAAAAVLASAASIAAVATKVPSWWLTRGRAPPQTTPVSRHETSMARVGTSAARSRRPPDVEEREEPHMSLTRSEPYGPCCHL